jgi:hypothetical protein
MFYSRVCAAEPLERSVQLSKVLQGKIDFPHSLCLHAVVVTADDWILLTRRSAKVAYHPGAWSCSIEEQLSERDFQGVGMDVVRHWVGRMLNEELGLRSQETESVDSRVLALFLEADKLNLGLAGIVSLQQDRQTLEAILAARPRQDYEFTEWTFVRWEALSEELAQPTLDYHPSAGLRMFLAGITRFGVYDFGVRLARDMHRNEAQRHAGPSSAGLRRFRPLLHRGGLPYAQVSTRATQQGAPSAPSEASDVLDPT